MTQEQFEALGIEKSLAKKVGPGCYFYVFFRSDDET